MANASTAHLRDDGQEYIEPSMDGSYIDRLGLSVEDQDKIDSLIALLHIKRDGKALIH